jgi:hypothetical protein
MTGRVIDDIIRASEALKDKGLFRAEKGFSRIGVFAGVFWAESRNSHLEIFCLPYGCGDA